MPTSRGAPSLTDIASDLQLNGLYEVDSRTWARHWRNQWVGFIDLIGFAGNSIKSPDTVLNWIVRCHRTITLAEGRHQPEKIVRFADSAFVADRSLEKLIKICTEVMPGCMAMNAAYLSQFQQRQMTGGARPPEWHHMIVPRITISFGRTLMPPLSARSASISQFAGVDLQSLMIGESLVRAHGIEKRTGGSILAIDPYVWDRAKRVLPPARGNLGTFAGGHARRGRIGTLRA